MRQRVGHRRVRQLRKQTGLPVIAALVRGGTDHRIDLCLPDGRIVDLYRDGTMEEADIGHSVLPEHWTPLDAPGVANENATGEG